MLIGTVEKSIEGGGYQDNESTAVKIQDSALPLSQMDDDEPNPDEPDLQEPVPTTGKSNPLLKQVLDITPPTPRDSSPLHLAINSIHPSKAYDDDHPISPTERKEGDVLPPIEICEFQPPSEDHEVEETDIEGYKSRGVSN